MAAALINTAKMRCSIAKNGKAAKLPNSKTKVDDRAMKAVVVATAGGKTAKSQLAAWEAWSKVTNTDTWKRAEVEVEAEATPTVAAAVPQAMTAHTMSSSAAAGAA